MKPLEPITGEPPKETWGFLALLKGEPQLPISGGWGYTREDACVIELDDSWEGIALEKEFAQRRIREEMIVQRLPGEMFRDIEWNMEMQALHRHEERAYDRLVFEVSGIPEADWQRLKAEYEGPEGLGSPGFDMDEHQTRREEARVRVKREFWFDITRFFGK